MKIGRLEIIWHKKAVDHPDQWSLLKIKLMIRTIESHNPKGKINRIKILRNLTKDYAQDEIGHELRWGLKEQKEWVERNYKNNGIIF